MESLIQYYHRTGRIESIRQGVYAVVPKGGTDPLYCSALRLPREQFRSSEPAQRYGLTVTVSTIERTLVDVINTPRWSGSWEEIWRSLESLEYVDRGL